MSTNVNFYLSHKTFKSIYNLFFLNRPHIFCAKFWCCLLITSSQTMSFCVLLHVALVVEQEDKIHNTLVYYQNLSRCFSILPEGLYLIKTGHSVERVNYELHTCTYTVKTSLATPLIKLPSVIRNHILVCPKLFPYVNWHCIKRHPVICDLQLDLTKNVAYDRGPLNTMSIYIRKKLWED